MSRKRGHENSEWDRPPTIVPLVRKDGKPRRKLKVGECRNCGKEFILKEVYGRSHEIGIPFCQKLCWQQWNDRRVRELREAGLPLISFIEGTEIIVCEVCGKHLKSIVGCHMQTHGIQTGGMCKLERNLIMGLYKGERCASEGQRERMKLNGRYDLKPPPGNKFPPGYNELQAVVPFKPESLEGVRIGQLKGALLMHERACETRQCKRPECGKEFTTIKSAYSRYCSKQCQRLHQTGGYEDLEVRAHAVVNLQRQGKSRHEVMAELGLTFKQVRESIAYFHEKLEPKFEEVVEGMSRQR